MMLGGGCGAGLVVVGVVLLLLLLNAWGGNAMRAYRDKILILI